MLKSMTAFGTGTFAAADRAITVELRSVNYKGLDCSIKLPGEYGSLAEQVRAAIYASGIRRGKLEVNIELRSLRTAETELRLDDEYCKSYIELLKKLRDTYSLTDDISVMKVAQNSNIFLQGKDTDEKSSEDILNALNEALDALCASRAAEGAALQSDITLKLEGVIALIDSVERLSRDDIGAYRERLEARLRRVLDEYGVKADESRILTECAIFADRVAVDEEIVRLKTHLEAFGSYLNETEPVGRKMDFLIQEMNREVNTIGSKCSNASIQAVVVNLKNELEKIREQIQNIE